MKALFDNSDNFIISDNIFQRKIDKYRLIDRTKRKKESSPIPFFLSRATQEDNNVQHGKESRPLFPIIVNCVRERDSPEALIIIESSLSSKRRDFPRD